MAVRDGAFGSQRLLVAVLVLASAAVLAGRFAASGDFGLSVWGDRDLWRALAIPQHWPLFGPESNGGTRTPGGAFYAILAAILAVGHGEVAVNFAVIALFAASILVTGLFFARRVSPLAGALVAASLAGSVTLGQTLGVWNPGFILIFATLATLWGYCFLAGGGALPLGLATAALAIGMQIHLQITQVAAGLVLASLIIRPRLTWRHGLAVALGAVIPYLPNIVSASTGLLQTAAALPGDAVNNYVFWEVDRLWQKAVLFGQLFGGGASQIGARVPGWLTLPLQAGDAVGLLLAAAGMGAMLDRRRRVFAVPAVCLFPLIVLVTAVTALVSDLLPRHMVAVTPAAAVLVGLTAERLVSSLWRCGRPALLLAVLAVGLIALRPLVFGGLGFVAPTFAIDSVAAQSEIAATVKASFFTDRDIFEARVGEFHRGGGGRWLAVSNSIPNHMSFLFQTIEVAPIASRDECLAVIAKTEAVGDLRKGLAASPSLAGMGAVFGEAAAESAHFLYLPYTTRDGNCLKTFPNGYIPTAFEAAYLPKDASASARSVNGAAIFVAPQAGHRDPTGIELRREGESLVAVLHGALLRGYTGLYFRSIAAASLCFVDDTGAQLVRFGNLTIGSPQRGTLAPWRSPAFSLAEGRYRVWLIGLDGKTSGPIRDALGSVSLPSLEAGPADGAVDPPAACLSQSPGR